MVVVYVLGSKGSVCGVVSYGDCSSSGNGDCNGAHPKTLVFIFNLETPWQFIISFVYLFFPATKYTA